MMDPADILYDKVRKVLGLWSSTGTMSSFRVESQWTTTSGIKKDRAFKKASEVYHSGQIRSKSVTMIVKNCRQYLPTRQKSFMILFARWNR